MIKSYSFINHPFYFVLSNANQMINGLDKAVAIFHNHNSQQLEAIEFIDNFHFLEFDKEFLNNCRTKSKEKFNWVSKEELPFSVKNQRSGQLSIEDESKNTILELRFQNKNDNKFDVIYFYFKPNVGHFKLINSNESMAVVAKEVVQKLLHQQIEILINENESNSSIHQKILEFTSTSKQNIELEKIKIQFFNHSKSTFEYVLEKILISESFEVVLSTCAIEKLMQLDLKLSAVEKILQDSIEIIINQKGPQNIYEITSCNLFISNPTKKENLTIKEENLNKTAIFLDKYEQAAKLLVSKNEKITGLNIGLNCSPEITPSAISDVFKKHKKKIQLLLQQYPNKWTTIRKEFKPLKALINKENSYLNRMSA